MPAHLSGQGIFLMLILFCVSVGLIVSGMVKDHEADQLCADCPVCKERKRQKHAERQEAKVASLIRNGICPKCRWMQLKAGHCDSCGKDWK